MTCQWIADEPSADDSCKCGKPTVNGVYCAKHLKAAYIKPWREGSPYPAPRPELRSDYR